MGFDDDYLDPDGLCGDIKPFKWKCFREKLPSSMKPMWVVWDDAWGECLFRTGGEALAFMDQQLRGRSAATRIREIMEGLK